MDEGGEEEEDEEDEDDDEGVEEAASVALPLRHLLRTASHSIFFSQTDDD